MTSGLFITLEGIEGAGKTTQLKNISAYFRQHGQEVITTKEPGGTPFGTTLRQLILDPNQQFAHHETELLLFYADRLEHVARVIKPALEKGHVVLCDRYIDSTTAYQIGGRGVNPSIITHLNEMINLKPDITILLNLSPEEGLKRAKKRAAIDRFEQEDIAFHQRVKETYLNIEKEDPNRVKRVNVEGLDPDLVFKKIKDILEAISF